MNRVLVNNIQTLLAKREAEERQAGLQQRVADRITRFVAVCALSICTCQSSAGGCFRLRLPRKDCIYQSAIRLETSRSIFSQRLGRSPGPQTGKQTTLVPSDA